MPPTGFRWWCSVPGLSTAVMTFSPRTRFRRSGWLCAADGAHPHYDGVPANQPDPAVIAVFGIGPVDVQVVDPTRPSWRQV